MLTYSDEPAIVSRALREGATGYLVHGTFDSDELVVAIKDTASGRSRLSPPAAAVLLQGFADGRREQPANAGLRVGTNGESMTPGQSIPVDVVRRFRLSRRETDICELLVRGHTNTQIAADLFIEGKTVKNHINRIFAKLGAPNRSAAIAICLGTSPEGAP